MIGYVTLGTNDMDRAARFYDALVAEMGGSRFMEVEGVYIAWAVDPQQAGLALTKPFNQEAATVGNGVMVALAADSPEQVDALHKKAMELGATDEGAPGPRGETFYAGYFRDPDGNKLNFFCITQAG